MELSVLLRLLILLREGGMFEGILSDKEFVYSAISMLIIGLALHKYRKKG